MAEYMTLGGVPDRERSYFRLPRDPAYAAWLNEFRTVVEFSRERGDIRPAPEIWADWIDFRLSNDGPTETSQP
jgi:hypothetical protein